MKKLIKKVEKKVDEIPDLLDTKLDIDELDPVKEHLKLLPKKDHVDRLENYVSTHIEKFKKDNTLYASNFYEHNEIIRRYDEVLSQKASRISLEAEV